MLKTLFKRSASLILSALLAWPQGLALSAAAAEKPVTLDGLEVAKDQLTVKLSAPTQYNSFLTANPPRLIIELMNTEFQAGAKTISGQGKYIKKIRSGQFERSPRMVARIVMDLSEVTGYRVVESATGLRVEIVDAEETAAAANAPAAEKPAEAPKPLAAAPAPVAAAKPAAKPAVRPKPKTSASPIENSPELAAMASKHDVGKGDLAPVPAASEAAESSGLAPAPAAAPAPEIRRAPRGSDILGRLPRDLVTLDFDNTDVRDIIKLLAAKARVNIIHGPDVSGSLTLHLTDVPFSEAFRTILSMLNLVTIQVGDNILRVLTPTELLKQRTSTTAITKVIPLNYSKASDLVAAIAAVRTAEGRTGAATADTKTNSLIVTEPLEGLAATERLIAQLDSRPKQVMIEAKLVEVSLNNSLHYGVQWDYFSQDRGSVFGQTGRNYIGTTVAPDASPFGKPYDQGVIAVDAKPQLGASGRGTGVNLAANAIFGALTLGRVTNNYFLNATLTAAAAQGKVKVLSDPKIATLNNQPANINVTTSIPYVTSNVASTGVQTQTVSYVITGIKLMVTPSINADGRITLEINPDVSQPSASAAASVTGAPAVDARTAKTTVLVKDGETIVIGGLISDSVSNQVAKIPILGDIPILGWLFRKKSVVRSRSELLIFVTPKIMPD